MKKIGTFLGFVLMVLTTFALCALSASAKEKTVVKSELHSYQVVNFDVAFIPELPSTPDLKVPLVEKVGLLPSSTILSETITWNDTYLVRSKRWIRLNNAFANRRFYALGREKSTLQMLKYNC